MSYDTHCCIVGGGPAGMILALLLGRAGVPTTILEEHDDFERDFRGDTVHSSTMELMDTLGLADRVLELATAKIGRLTFDAPGGPVVMADLGRLPTKFPYVTMMPQARFLDFLAGELARMPSVKLVMGAAVQGLLWDDPWGLSGIADRAPDPPPGSNAAPSGSTSAAQPTAQGAPPSHGAVPRQATAGHNGAAPHPAPARPAAHRPDAPGHGPLPDDAIVRGVHYRTRDGQHDLRAPLTIAADGRFSRIRRLAGFELQSSAPPMDIVWFRLPRRPDEPDDGRGKIGHGHMMILLNRGQDWQIAYVIPKGAYREIHDAGLPKLRQAIAELAPELADRVDTITDWHQTALLSVEAGRIKRWYRPGLLLIGDAAHVMSPVGGVGINYAIQDAVVAANVLTKPLKLGRLRLRDLAAVQRQREIPTRIIQGFQRLVQEQVVTQALASDAPMQPPPALRLPVLRDLVPRMLALGVWPVHLKS
jgi:2-polyprenyl-6-methoxyphenol hydroxylase-like FAD-dependent oxidoreductase